MGRETTTAIPAGVECSFKGRHGGNSVSVDYNRRFLATLPVERADEMPTQGYNATMPTHVPLARTSDGKIAGVCGGLAVWLDLDPTAVRVAWALFTFLTAVFPGFLLYLLLWLLMPSAEDAIASSGTWILSRQHRMIGGVCGGLADWLGWDPTAVRILYVVLSLCSAAFPGSVVYILLWILLPRAEG